MDKRTVEELLSRLDAETMRLESLIPTSRAESPHPGVVVYAGMDIASIPGDKVPLIHTMLHMFYANRTGRGLRRKDIIELHRDVAKRMHLHQKFDKLDETV